MVVQKKDVKLTEKMYDILLRPIITEKSTLVAEQGKIVFAVRTDATKTDIKNGNLKHLEELIASAGINKVAESINVGVPTLEDIVKELAKPGRDIRDDLPKPELKSELLDISNLKEGMVLHGTVRNVIDFGVFVDISVHQDGLVHISEISKDYIKHPSEVLKVGDRVVVKVIGVDVQKKRISLTIKGVTEDELAEMNNN